MLPYQGSHPLLPNANTITHPVSQHSLAPFLALLFLIHFFSDILYVYLFVFCLLPLEGKLHVDKLLFKKKYINEKASN